MARTKADELATQRFQIIAPLLDGKLDAQELKKLREQICQRNGLSERTIRRYVAQFKKEGFEGLKQKPYRSVPGESQDNMVEQAIHLRREVPSRSITSNIQILEWDGMVAKGELKRSTLQERLFKRGYSARQMKMYHEDIGSRSAVSETPSKCPMAFGYQIRTLFTDRSKWDE